MPCRLRLTRGPAGRRQEDGNQEEDGKRTKLVRRQRKVKGMGLARGTHLKGLAPWDCGSPCMSGALAACTGLSRGYRGCPACPSQPSVPVPSPADPTAASGASRLCGPHLVTPSCSQDSLISSRITEPPLPHAQYPLIPKKVCGLGIHW